VATKEELSDQLTLMTKLAAQVERMSAAAEKLEQSYATQIDTLQKMSNVLGQVNTQASVQNVEVLNKALRGMQDKMKDTGKTSEATFQKLGKKVEEAGKSFRDKFPKSVAIAAGALSGFYQGVRNVVALGKGVVGFFTSFVDGLVNVAASIIAIPFKIFSGLVDMAAQSAGGMNELAQAIENLRKEFGYLYGPTNKTIIGMTTSLKGFSDTGLSAWRVFGNMAQRLEAFQKLASEMGATFVTLKAEFEKSGGALLGYQKGLGLSEEHMKAVAQLAISMGGSLGDTLKETTKYSLELAKAFGLDAKVLSRDVGKAMQDVKHFAGATIREISQAATYARKLGVELDKITGTLDAFETFDTAAENVAKLSQSFGVQVDAFKLMEAQDPAEQIDMLRKSFAKAGVDASQFNRQQLKLLSTTTGLDEATARQAFSLKNQGISLDQVKKKGSDAEKKTLTQAQAMSKLADAIERMVQSGGGLKGGFWDTFVEGIKNGVMSSKEFITLMRNIQRALRDVYMIGVQLGRTLVKIVPGVQDILGGMSDFFQPKHFDKLFGGISASVKRFFSADSQDPNAIPFLVEDLQATFMDFLTAEGPHGKRILEGFKTFFRRMSDFAAQAIEFLGDKIREGIEFVTDMVTGKRSLDLSGAKGAAQGGLGFLGKLIVPLIDALKHAWKKVQPALFELLHSLADVAWKWVKQHKDVFINIGEAILGYLFAMSLVRAATGLLAKVVVDAAAGLLTGATSVILKKMGADVMAGMFEDAGGSTGVMGAINKALNRAFGGAKGTGAAIGDKIGSSAAESMGSKMPGIGGIFNKSIMGSGLGQALGLAAGVAAVAYIGIEGKKLIDETFAKGHKADVNLRSTEMEAYLSKSRSTPLEKKLEEIKKLQEAIQAQQEKLADKGFGEKALDWVAGTNVAADQAADALAKSQRTLAELQEQVKKIQETSTTGLDQVKKKASEVANVTSMMPDTSVVPAVAQKLDDIKGFSGTLQQSLKDMATLPAEVNKVAVAVKRDAFVPAIEAIRSMVKVAQELDDALSDGNINKIDIKAKLERVARAVGLGGKAQYTVNPNKQVQVVVNLQVSMDVDKVEKVMIMRKQSIIRDRLNYATGDTAGQPGNPPIPDAFQNELPSITGGTQS
jgi:hypothetical protein